MSRVTPLLFFWGILLPFSSSWSGSSLLSEEWVQLPRAFLLNDGFSQNVISDCHDFKTLTRLQDPESYKQTLFRSEEQKGKKGLYGRTFSLWDHLILTLALYTGQPFIRFTEEDKSYQRFRTLKISEALKKRELEILTHFPDEGLPIRELGNILKDHLDADEAAQIAQILIAEIMSAHREALSAGG